MPRNELGHWAGHDMAIHDMAIGVTTEGVEETLRQYHDGPDFDRAVGFVGMVCSPGLSGSTIKEYAEDIAAGLLDLAERDQRFGLALSPDDLVDSLERDLTDALQEATRVCVEHVAEESVMKYARNTALAAPGRRA